MRFTWRRPNGRQHSRSPFIALAPIVAGGLLVMTVGSAARGENRPVQTFLYVANHFDDSVSAVDTGARKVVATVPVGTAPSGVAAAPRGDRVYVAYQGSDDVSVIETRTDRRVATIRVRSAPTGVAVSRDGRFVYVTDSGSNSMSARGCGN